MPSRESRETPRRHLWRALLVLLAVGIGLPPADAQKPLSVKTGDSEIAFEATQMGVTVRGGFSDWEADMAIDEANPEDSRARVVVRTASIDTGHSDTDREVKKKNWLAVEQFPEAVFEAEQVRRRDDGQWLAEGPLRIRDVSRDIEVPFALERLDDGRMRMEGGFSIKRADYDVGGGAWGDFDVVANEVRIDFTLVVAP